MCRAWPIICRDEFLCTSVLLVAEWARKAQFVSHKAVIASQKRHYGLLHFDISNCKCTLSTYIVLKAGVCVCLHFYLVSTASLQSGGPSLCPVGGWSPLSGPGCDGWAEEDPGIRASAYSSSVLSSAEETGRKKTINLECILILRVAYTWYANLYLCYYCSSGHFVMQNTMFPLCSHKIITFQSGVFIYSNLECR